MGVRDADVVELVRLEDGKGENPGWGWVGGAVYKKEGVSGQRNFSGDLRV